MSRMKEFFDDVFSEYHGPAEAEVERMQLQSAMHSLDEIANELEELLYRNRYYGDELDYAKIEDIHTKLKQVLRTYN